MERPCVEDLIFKCLCMLYSLDLIRLFIEDEVKQKVWNFDSFKRFGPDGISFDFIKDFWSDIK